jgi:hypothetical protein
MDAKLVIQGAYSREMAQIVVQKCFAGPLLKVICANAPFG